GVYYGNSYLQINGEQIKDMGVTAGFGINSLKTPLAYSITFQYGVKGTTKNNLIRENYFNVTFNINYGSIWYTKGKKFEKYVRSPPTNAGLPDDGNAELYCCGRQHQAIRPSKGLYCQNTQALLFR